MEYQAPMMISSFGGPLTTELEAVQPMLAIMSQFQDYARIHARLIITPTRLVSYVWLAILLAIAALNQPLS